MTSQTNNYSLLARFNPHGKVGPLGSQRSQVCRCFSSPTSGYQLLLCSHFVSSTMVLHVKYPIMERQDLTQAQLGSFKFTPVDEAVHQTPQPNPHPLLLQQYTDSLQSAGFNQQLTSPDIAADPSFFNHQIRPSLDNSRLRFGPAAVRAAVESASWSPQNHFNRSNQASMHPNVSCHHGGFIFIVSS